MDLLHAAALDMAKLSCSRNDHATKVKRKTKMNVML